MNIEIQESNQNTPVVCNIDAIKSKCFMKKEDLPRSITICYNNKINYEFHNMI